MKRERIIGEVRRRGRDRASGVNAAVTLLSAGGAIAISIGLAISHAAATHRTVPASADAKTSTDHTPKVTPSARPRRQLQREPHRRASPPQPTKPAILLPSPRRTPSASSTSPTSLTSPQPVEPSSAPAPKPAPTRTPPPAAKPKPKPKPKPVSPPSAPPTVISHGS